MTENGRYWLRFQLAMALAGGSLWYLGASLDSDFTSGLGVGVLVSALALRLVRGRADRD